MNYKLHVCSSYSYGIGKQNNKLNFISAILMYVNFKLQSLQYLLKCYFRIILSSLQLVISGMIDTCLLVGWAMTVLSFVREEQLSD